MACADGRSSVSLPWCPGGLRDRQRAHDDAMAKIGLGAGWRGVGSRADSQTRGVSCLARSHDRTVLRGACAWCVKTDPPCSTRAFPAARSAEAGGNNNNQISSVRARGFHVHVADPHLPFRFRSSGSRSGIGTRTASTRALRDPARVPRVCGAYSVYITIAAHGTRHSALYQLPSLSLASQAWRGLP